MSLPHRPLCSSHKQAGRTARRAGHRGDLLQGGKPTQRGPLLHDEDYTIVAKYGAEYRGFVQYYLLAHDVFRLGTLRWVMETSMLRPWPENISPPLRRWTRK